MNQWTCTGRGADVRLAIAQARTCVPTPARSRRPRKTARPSTTRSRSSTAPSVRLGTLDRDVEAVCADASAASALVRCRWRPHASAVVRDVSRLLREFLARPARLLLALSGALFGIRGSEGADVGTFSVLTGPGRVRGGFCVLPARAARQHGGPLHLRRWDLARRVSAGDVSGECITF